MADEVDIIKYPPRGEHIVHYQIVGSAGTILGCTCGWEDFSNRWAAHIERWGTFTKGQYQSYTPAQRRVHEAGYGLPYSAPPTVSIKTETADPPEVPEMVERVARAISPLMPNCAGTTCVFTPIAKCPCGRMARAAIAAMREPTAEMLACLSGREESMDEILQGWHDAIDAALGV